MSDRLLRCAAQGSSSRYVFFMFIILFFFTAYGVLSPTPRTPAAAAMSAWRHLHGTLCLRLFRLSVAAALQG